MNGNKYLKIWTNVSERQLLRPTASDTTDIKIWY